MEEAVATLESVFHPVMRDEDLYTRAIQHRDGKRFINGLEMEFALVPGGTFWMGGQDGKCGDNKVTIERDFYIGVYPVTQEEWQKVMGGNPSHFRKGGPGADKLSGVSDADLKRFPVETVSWNDCQVFTQKLNERLKETGWMYRLPREAEWEYACRGAADTKPSAAGTSTCDRRRTHFRVNRPTSATPLSDGRAKSGCTMRTPWVFTTCTATSGSGAKTPMTARAECSGAVAGETLPSTVVRRPGTGTRPRTRTSTWACDWPEFRLGSRRGGCGERSVAAEKQKRYIEHLVSA